MYLPISPCISPHIPISPQVIHKDDVEAILGKRPFDPGMLGNGHNPVSSNDRAGELDVQPAVQPAMVVEDPAPKSTTP